MSSPHSRHIKNDVSIVLCGEAGQGIQTIEQVLTHVLKLAGHNVFATKEYMSRIRGGSNSTEIRVASSRIAAYVDRIDILVALDEAAIPHLGKRITDKTILLGDSAQFQGTGGVMDVPFARIAAKAGSKLYANIVAVGAVLGIMGVEFNLFKRFLTQFFAAKERPVVEGNIKAGKQGYDVGRGLCDSGGIHIEIQRSTVENDLLMNGATAVGLGAIAGGCNFIASYPMSPSTGVLVFLARHAAELGIIAEQAEDEIAAINMGLGAWYAGARALVTTSGGGFALMSEGMSLAGMTETPIVVHLAQRPGPATGLPTRTEQGDLNLALYAGHGEFPRIILAPGTVREAFSLTQKAFNLADKHQVPVIILTDQFLVDSFYNVSSLDLDEISVERCIVATDKDYQRYKLTDNGVSPRGIPGYGAGLVCVDSDEHDEAGHITEDLDLRVKMVDKRLRKIHAMIEDAMQPELVGPEDYAILLVAWGSTYHVVREAIEESGRKDMSLLHFKQLYPLPAAVGEYFNRAKKTVVIENNPTAQFAQLIQLYTGVHIENRILQYNGLPFSVEAVTEKLREMTA